MLNELENIQYVQYFSSILSYYYNLLCIIIFLISVKYVLRLFCCVPLSYSSCRLQSVCSLQRN